MIIFYVWAFGGFGENRAMIMLTTGLEENIMVMINQARELTSFFMLVCNTYFFLSEEHSAPH